MRINYSYNLLNTYHIALNQVLHIYTYCQVYQLFTLQMKCLRVKNGGHILRSIGYHQQKKQDFIIIIMSYNFFKLINLFIFIYYFWLCWVFVSAQGLSPVAASGGHSSLRCAGLSLLWPLLFRSTGSRRARSVVVAHGPSCSVACGILPDQGPNPRPLHQQADCQPLRHQGSPNVI